MFIRIFLAALLLFVAMGARAETKNALSTAEIQGRQLARELCDAQPAGNFTNSGVLKIRDASGKRLEPLVTVVTTTQADGWETSYSATLNLDKDRMEYALSVTHAAEHPNVYHSSGQNAAGPLDKKLSGNETMIPFAGSDFWVADLGLEFFHWPEQKILKREIKRSRGCAVLESTNPNPSTNGYSRVVSWIDNESGGIVQAEAYDDKNKLLKEFAPKSFKKVNGQWELQEMEIRNVQTGSRTRLEFDLRTLPPAQ